jgi:hypothetical protein
MAKKTFILTALTDHTYIVDKLHELKQIKKKKRLSSYQTKKEGLKKVKGLLKSHKKRELKEHT